ncbi:MAG: hypothetical protein IRZ21_11565 [Thermoleophilaceae bacterium]|nr:hypothetical protein [Thermoleophilaceae bacterium]
MKPQVVGTKKSKKYPQGKKYQGTIRHRGEHRWVGTFASADEWKARARKIIEEIDREKDGASRKHERTVGEYTGLTFDRKLGRVVPRPGAVAAADVALHAPAQDHQGHCVRAHC